MNPRNVTLSLLAAAGALACAVPRDVAEGAAGGACTGCHGDAARSGSALSRAAPVTGAHLAHLDRDVACASCHEVPTDPAHSDGVVEVAFGGVALAGGAQPAFSAGTCTNVYCHGATLRAGGNGAVPVTWSGAPLDCVSCHGAPPPSHSAGSTTCSACHPGTVKADGTIDRANGLHVNGRADGGGAQHGDGWSDPARHGPAAKSDLASCQGCHGFDFSGGSAGVSCNACHGGAAWASNCTFCHGAKQATYAAADLPKAAPPRGTNGETAATDPAVGAHQKHLSGGSFGGPVACAECHAVPADLSHLDGAAQVTFGSAARRDGAAPRWSGATCASTYCHGGTLSGGAVAAPSWTGSSQVYCGSCHGLPPTVGHTTSTACAGCHGYDGASFDAALHLNGTVDSVAGASHPSGWSAKDQHGFAVNRSGLSSCKGCHGTGLTGGAGPSCGSCHPGGGTAWATNCTFCHGTGTQPAPPVDTQGRSATTNVSVGAHAAHLGTTIAATPACTECHESRSSVITDAAHVDGDGVAEVTFGALARTGGAVPVYARASATSATCASTYCHGRFGGGVNAGQGATMNWTSTAQVSCSSCHGIPPSSGRHSRSEHRNCGDCHPGYTASSVTRATHLDGTKQVGNRIRSYDPRTRTCSNSCHGNETW